MIYSKLPRGRRRVVSVPAVFKPDFFITVFVNYTCSQKLFNVQADLLADHVTVMRQGRTEAHGTPATLRKVSKPCHLLRVESSESLDRRALDALMLEYGARRSHSDSLHYKLARKNGADVRHLVAQLGQRRAELGLWQFSVENWPSLQAAYQTIVADQKKTSERPEGGKESSSSTEAETVRQWGDEPMEASP